MDPRHWPLDRRATRPGTMPTSTLRADPTYGEVRDADTPPRDPTGQLDADIKAHLRVLDGEAQNHIEVLTGRRLQQVVFPRDETPTVPVLTTLTPNTAVLGSPSFTLSVKGTGFGPASVLYFAGNPEPTTLVSATEVTTGVDMSVWHGPDALPVSVSNGGEMSNELTFTFTAAPAP